MARVYDMYDLGESDFRPLKVSDIGRESDGDAPVLVRFHDGTEYVWLELAQDDGGEDERKGGYVVDFDPPALDDGRSFHVCVIVEHEETARTRSFLGSSSLGVREATLDALATADAYYRAGKVVPLSVHPCRIGEAIGS